MHDYDYDCDEDGFNDVFEAAAEALISRFVWCETAEGHEFYSNLHDALLVASFRLAESDFPETDLCYETEYPLSDAASALVDAFAWGATPEGYNFWDNVHADLFSLWLGELPTYTEGGPEDDPEDDPEDEDFFDDVTLICDCDMCQGEGLGSPSWDTPVVQRYFDALDDAAEKAI